MDLKPLKRWALSRSLWTFVGSLAVMAAVAFAYFYPDASQGATLSQPDIQQGLANGQETADYEAATGRHSWWTGSLFSGMPTFQISPTYASSRLFAWIGTAMGAGLPSPANLLLMMAVGMFILLIAMRMRWYVALIGALAYAFSSYFIIIIGAGHIWKFVTLAYIPPTLAGIVLCYRGRYVAGAALTAIFGMMQIAANHPQMTYYFLPVAAGFMVVYLCQAARDGEWKRFGIATACVVAAAGLATVANLPSLYNTYEYSKLTIRGGHSELTPAGGEGAGQSTSGLDRDYITQYSYGRSELFTLLIPNVKGGSSARLTAGAMAPVSLADLPEASQAAGGDELTTQYLQYMSQYFGEPEGTNGPVYVGALIFALFLVGCIIVKGPWKWVLLVLTLLSVCLALGRNMQWLTDLMIDYMPMYNKFRTVESILVVAEFTMPLLAVMALQKLVEDREGGWARYRAALSVGFGVSLLLCLAAILTPSIYGEAVGGADRMVDEAISQQLQMQGYPADVAAQFSLANPRILAAVEALRYSMVEADGLRSFIVVALGLGLLLLYYRRLLGLEATVALIGLVIVGDLYLVNKRYLSSSSFTPATLTATPPVQMTDADRWILSDTTTHYRVLDIPGFQAATPSYYHHAVGGYHAAKLTRYQDLIDRHLARFVAGGATAADSAVVDMLNTRYILGRETVELNPGALGNVWFVDTVTYVKGADAEMDALDSLHPATRAVADEQFRDRLGQASLRQPGDTAYLTTYAPDRLTYHVTSARGGVLVFSEVYFPWGWEVTVDGEAAGEPSRVDYVLRALRVPAGSHEVAMEFKPRSVAVTERWATVSVILIYVLAAGAIGVWCAGLLRGRGGEASGRE